MNEFTVVTKRCPVCHVQAVGPIDNKIRVNPPSHRCASCGAVIRTALTRQALWCIPVSVAALLSMWIISLWLKEISLPSVVRVAISGGLFGLVMSISMRSFARGIVFREFKQ